MKGRGAAFLLMTCLYAGLAVAQPGGDYTRMVVTTRGDDYSPAVSPDGRHLVFVSNREGSPGLYSRRLDRPFEGDSELYAHPARTFDPVFSPDGRYLAFVSDRTDALGDVFLAAVWRGTPLRLSASGVIDRSPRFSADGAHLFFESSFPEGERVWTRHTIRTGVQEEVDESEVPQPGRTVAGYPVLMVNERAGLALVYADDTNADGVLGDGDRTSVWERDAGGQWRQVTRPLRDAGGVDRVSTTDEILVSARWTEELDIAAVGETDLRTSSDHGVLMELGRDAEERSIPDLNGAIAYFRGAALTAGDGVRRREALRAKLNAMDAAGRFSQVAREAAVLRGADEGEAWERELEGIELAARLLAHAAGMGRERLAAADRERALERLVELRGEWVAEEEWLRAAEASSRLARVHIARGDDAAALEEADRITREMAEFVPVEYRARAILLRADVYRRAGLLSEASDALFDVYTLNPRSPALLARAAEMLVESVTEVHAAGDARILALRDLVARGVDAPFLMAAGRVAEGNALVEIEDFSEARRAWEQAVALVQSAPAPAAQGGVLLAELFTRQGEYARALAVLRELRDTVEELSRNEELYPGTRELYNRLRRELIRFYLEKARMEMSLGDPMLAHGTYEELLTLEPELPGAWRGKINALSYRPEALARETREYRREARNEPEKALNLYKYALGLSYPDPSSRRALRLLEDALRIDSLTPHYHLASAYVREQIFRDGLARGHSRRDQLDAALESLDRAVNLVDTEIEPGLRADILLNSGNVAMLLDQYMRATSYFRRREAAGVPFEDPRTAFLFHLNAGIAAFRASFPGDAIVQFDRADDALTAVEQRGFIEEETAAGLRLDILNRKALAHLDGGNDGTAAALFSSLYTRSDEGSVARVRAARNEAFARMRMAEWADGAERSVLARQARNAAERALVDLDAVRSEERSRAPSGGLLGMSFVYALDDAEGGALFDLDRRDERRFIVAIQSRAAQIEGDHAGEVEALREQLTLDPRIDDTNRAYFHAARTVALSRLAGASARVGDHCGGLEHLLEGLALTRFEVKPHTFVNSNAATRLLALMAELVLHLGDEAESMLLEADSFWMLEGEPVRAGDGAWRLLERAAARMLEMEDPQSYGRDIPLVVEPVERARLLYVIALATEQEIYRALDEMAELEGADFLSRSADVVGGAEALSRLAAETLSQTVEHPNPVEIHRLYVLIRAAGLRVAPLVSDEGSDALLTDVLEEAERLGFASQAWWLTGQAALAERDGAKALRLAEESRRRLLNDPVYTRDTPMNGVRALVDRLEALELSAAREADGAAACWNIADAWRAARLRLLADAGGDLLVSDSREDAWLAEFRSVSAAIRDIDDGLRGLAPGNAERVGGLMESRGRLVGHLSRHVAAGRDGGFAAARYLAPAPVDIETVRELLAGMDFEGGKRPVLVLNRRLPGLSLSAVYTDDSEEFAEADSVPAEGVMFLLGDSAAGMEDAISIVSSEDLLHALQTQRFRVTRETAVYTGDVMPASLPYDYGVKIDVPVYATGPQPGQWIMGEAGLPLVSVAGALREPGVLEVLFAEGAGDPEAELRLAAWLAQRGYPEALINGRRWIGVDRSSVASVAEEQFQVEVGRFETRRLAGDESGALLSLERMIPIAGTLEKDGELRLAWRELAYGYRAARDWRRAELAASNWRAHEAGGTEGRAVANRIYGEVLARIPGREDRMREVFSEALGIYRNAGNDREVLETLRGFAVALENAGIFGEALERTAEARELAEPFGPEEVIAEEFRAARILRLASNRFPEAEDRLQVALTIAEEAGLERLEAETYIRLGRVYRDSARFEEADRVLDRADAIVERLDDSGLRAESLLERANVHWFRGEYAECFALSQRALAIAERLESLPLQVAVRNLIGLNAWTVNDYGRAFSSLHRAMEQAEEYDVPGEIATTANNTGLIHRSLKEWDEALRWFRRSLETDRAQGNRWGIAYSQRNIGLTYIQGGHAARALEPLEEAIRLSSEIGDGVNHAKALQAMGEALAALDRRAEARARFGEALEMARRLSLPEVEWRAVYGLAMLARADGNDDEAVALLNEATDLIDAMRASIRVEEFQDGFLADKQSVYDDLIALLIVQGNHRGALEASERARGRNFIDLLGNRRIDLKDTADAEMLEREGELRARIEALERRAATASPGEHGAIEPQLREARAAYSDFLITLRAHSPELAGFVRVDPVDAEELEQLLDADTRLLVYHVLPDRPVCWLIGPGTIDFFDMQADSADTIRLLDETRRGIQNLDDVDGHLEQLAQRLIVPVLPRLAGVRRLGIVPHRELHTLPFAGLRIGPGEHLVDRVGLFYSPSATVLRYTMGRRPERMGATRTLAIGNPDRGTRLFDLPFAEKEAERLAFDLDDVTVRVGAQATESWLVENLADFGIIHIASHGEYRSDAPLFSALLLAPDESNDGVLTAQEVFGLQIRADLVALSACQTGLGRLGNGDDIVGLNRAFVYAGTRQLMTTLWRVDDVSTAVLFKYFYRNTRGMDRAEAVRRAQVRLKNRPEYRHPAHWSGLVLSGDWM